MKRSIKNILGSRAAELKKKGEDCSLYGIRAADMTRDELLIFIGMAGETITGERASSRQALDFMREVAQARCEYPFKEPDPPPTDYVSCDLGIDCERPRREGEINDDSKDYSR